MELPTRAFYIENEIWRAKTNSSAVSGVCAGKCLQRLRKTLFSMGGRVNVKIIIYQAEKRRSLWHAVLRVWVLQGSVQGNAGKGFRKLYARCEDREDIKIIYKLKEGKGSGMQC
jgi:hypothetical protein